MKYVKVKVLPAAAVPFEPLWWIVPAKPEIVLPRSPLWRVGHAAWLAGASLAAAAGNRPWGHSSHPHRRPQKRLRTRCTNSPPHCPEERKPHKILQSHLWHTNFNLIRTHFYNFRRKKILNFREKSFNLDNFSSVDQIKFSEY